MKNVIITKDGIEEVYNDFNFKSNGGSISDGGNDVISFTRTTGHETGGETTMTGLKRMKIVTISRMTSVRNQRRLKTRGILTGECMPEKSASNPEKLGVK